MGCPYRILFVLPPSGNIYMNMFIGFKQAFERAGWLADIITVTSEMNQQNIIELLSPDVIMTVNDMSARMSYFPPGVIHICWIQDHSFMGSYYLDLDRLPGDITYFCTPHLRSMFRNADVARYPILPFATDPSVFSPNVTGEYTGDISVIGYIFNANIIFNAPFEIGTHRLKLGDYARYFMAHSGATPSGIWHPFLIEQIIQNWLTANNISKQDYAATPAIHGSFNEDVPRSLNRYLITRELLGASDKIILYGPNDWVTWPDMRSHYRHHIERASELADAYRQSRLSLHNGGYLSHPRMIDGLSCGAVMLANADAYSDDFEGGGKIEPGVHFIPYQRTSLLEISRTVLADVDLQKRISESAMTLVRDYHTWDHRVKQVIKDIGYTGIAR